MKRKDFKEWLENKYPNLKPVTIVTTVSDAFYIFNHDIGISFNDLLVGNKTINDFKESIRKYLISNGKNPGTRPSGYTSHLRYLIEYALELGLTNVDMNTEMQKKHKGKPNNKIPLNPDITKHHVEKAYEMVECDPIYGEENRVLNKILNMFPMHDSIEEIICKISVIDVTHSTHVGIHKKKFSLVDLAQHIQSIPDIDNKLKVGDKNLINEISNINGVSLLSFASKYCACHNQMIYNKDDYYKYDSVVSKAIGFRKRDYEEYLKKLDEIVTDNNLEEIENIRLKLDYYFWYNNK